MSLAQDEGTAHDVLFAESDAELVRVAGDRLAAGLASGAAEIVIATPEHRDSFVAAIRDAGLDPEAAARDGSLALLDAAETLAAFTGGGAFDARAFDRVVGSLVREAAAGRSVDAFGEMVALLWDAGRVAEAIELERAWEELLRETSATLLCAYPIRLVDDLETAPALRTVCGLHGRIVSHDPLERSWRFDYDLTAASRARRAVSSALRVRGVAEAVFYDVQSVLTELVGNALHHTRSAISVGLSVLPDRVVVRVEDQHPEPPVVRAGDGRAARRGLRVVHELADRWGVEPSGAGKVVWAEVYR